MELLEYMWVYNGDEVIDNVPETAVGFIYKITNNIDGRVYYGKKVLKFKKTTVKTLKRKNGDKYKKKIRTEVSSDWDTYYGSSEELKSDVERHGSQNFTREIIRYCYTSSEMTYYEAKVQFETDCLLYPDRFYNAWIMVRVRRDHLIKKK